MNHDKSDAPQHSGDESKHRIRGMQGVFQASATDPRKEYNRRWLLLVVDIGLLAAIVATIFFLVSLLTPGSFFASSREEIRRVTYTVELAGVDRDSLSSLQVGDAVTDQETGAVIGKVTAVTPRSYEVYTDIPERDGDTHVVTKTTYPEDINTFAVTISVDAIYEVGVGYTVDDCRIAVGREYVLCFPGYTGDGVCVTFNAEEVAS